MLPSQISFKPFEGDGAGKGRDINQTGFIHLKAQKEVRSGSSHGGEMGSIQQQWGQAARSGEPHQGTGLQAMTSDNWPLGNTTTCTQVWSYMPELPHSLAEKEQGPSHLGQGLLLNLRVLIRKQHKTIYDTRNRNPDLKAKTHMCSIHSLHLI